MYRNYPENLGGLGKIWGGLCPPGPTLEPPLVPLRGEKAEGAEGMDWERKTIGREAGEEGRSSTLLNITFNYRCMGVFV